MKIMEVIIILVSSILVLFTNSISAQELSCLDQENSNVVYSVTKVCEQAGNWNTKIDFNVENSGGPYEVQVKQEIAAGVCSDDGLVDVTVTISGPLNNFTQPPDDYEYFEDVGYYKYYSKADIWDNARHTCDKDGAHLVILNSDAESNVVKTILDRSKTESLSGFHDRFVEGEYLTIFGEPLSSSGFYKWSKNQPDNGFGTEDCGHVYGTGLLNDVNCTIKLPFICEFKPKKIKCDI